MQPQGLSSFPKISHQIIAGQRKKANDAIITKFRIARTISATPVSLSTAFFI